MERLTRRPPFIGYADFDQWNFVAFDLKSATDRWPLSVMHDLMACLFGPTLASSIVNGTLGLNTFHVCPPLLWCDEHNTGDILPGWSSTGILRLLDTVRAVSPLYYIYIIWLAAEMFYPSSMDPFTSYAILGDDVVIADAQVAKQYCLLLEQMGVSISLSKSLI